MTAGASAGNQNPERLILLLTPLVHLIQQPALQTALNRFHYWVVTISISDEKRVPHHFCLKQLRVS